MILVIDNYDSFTYNIVQVAGMIEPSIKVYRNDRISIDEIKKISPSGIIISPGPGHPENAGISMQLINELGKSIPILGVCLGHQAIALVYGGKVVSAPELMHGKISNIKHNATSLYRGIPNGFEAGRYHSLVVDKESLPEVLEITSQSIEGVIMGIKHKEYPVEGIQFHPESVLTSYGDKIIKNWIEQC